MTNPNINAPVPEPVYSATKAISASLVLAGGLAALIVKNMADGSITWDEAGEIIGAAVVAGGSVLAVWRARNEPKRA